MATIIPTQQVYTSQSTFSVSQDGTIALPIIYNTSDAERLSGITLNLHYNSSLLTPFGENSGFARLVNASIVSGGVIIDDTSNLDGDAQTDKIVQLLWATFDNSFPSTATLPATLGTETFKTTSAFGSTIANSSSTIRFSATETASGYDFLPSFATVTTAGTVAAVNDGAATFAVSGTALVGQVLTVAKTTDDPDGNGTFTYQWQSSTNGSTWGTIGVNSATYTLTAAEQSKQVRVQVSYTDGQNFSESLTVAAGTVAAVNDGAATFTVSGNALVGQVLTVAKTADDPDGNGTFTYQWQSSTDGSTWGTIGTNAST